MVWYQYQHSPQSRFVIQDSLRLTIKLLNPETLHEERFIRKVLFLTGSDPLDYNLVIAEALVLWRPEMTESSECGRLSAGER